MRRAQRQVEEERFACPGAGSPLIDIVHRLLRERGKHIRGFEIGRGRSLARHSAAATEHHGKGFVHGGNGRDTVVLDKRVRNHVERCADSEIVVKADLVRSIADRPGEIDAPARFAFLDVVVELFRARLESPVHAEVPLADASGVIPALLEKRRHGESSRLDQPRAHPAQHAALEARTPIIAAGENAVARRRTDRRTGMRIGENHSGRGQSVHVRRGDLAVGIEAFNVPITQVIAKQIHDVRRGPFRDVSGTAIADDRSECERRDETQSGAPGRIPFGDRRMRLHSS